MVKKSKTFVLAILVLTLCKLSLQAQVFDPVKWSTSIVKIDESTYQVNLRASVDASWHIYSQYTPKGGPLPTAITMDGTSNYELVGTVSEIGDLVEKYEEVFGIKTRFYNHEVTFRQMVKAKTKAPQTITGTVKFMVCNDTRCLPPKDVEFKITLR
jgi:thiol:disulfide interchange protein DsbD